MEQEIVVSIENENKLNATMFDNENEINGMFNLDILKGDKGDKGDIGDTGATFTPSVSSNGDLSWSNDKNLPNPQTVNIKGPKGDTGATGPKGQDGTVSFDELTESQKAELKGDKGDKGDTGDTGPQGEQGLKGEKGDTGATGPANVLTIGSVTSGTTASASITGESPNQTLNLVIPKGDKGDTGNNGVSITTITSGTPTQSGDYTVTPITINKSDSSNVTINVSAKNGLDGSQGTIDYTELENKPKINNVELNGNKTLSNLGIQQTYIGTTQPTDESVEVWINPSGDSVTVPTKTSDLTNDSGFITNESDPTVPSHVKSITQSNITSWNNKSDFSGSYNDLTNKPTIPTFSYDSSTKTLTITG